MLINQKMKAIVSNDYGSIQNLHLVTDYIHPCPALALDLDNSKTKNSQIPKGRLLIKTQAVAIAPGDVRVLSGACKKFQGPPSFPYIPGGDLCGIIVDMDMDMNKNTNKKTKDSTSTTYNVGDRIAARFTEGPRGALGEYTLVNPQMASQVPSNLSSSEAAALASSATIALCLSKKWNITPQERVVIMGSGGGVGSHLCQLLRIKGVKCIAAASHDPERMKKEPLLCDYALDYTEKDVYDLEEWNKVGMPAVDEKFDTVIDLSGGGWLRLLEQRRTSASTSTSTNANANAGPTTTTTTSKMIVKSAKEGGRYLTLVPDVYNFEMHTIWQAMKLFLFANIYRHVSSRSIYRATLPAHSYAISLDNDVEIMKETLKLASENKLIACIDDRGPFEFTTEGVRQAFELQASRHVRGKVVVTVSSDGNGNGNVDDKAEAGAAAGGGLKNPQDSIGA